MDGRRTSNNNNNNNNDNNTNNTTTTNNRNNNNRSTWRSLRVAVHLEHCIMRSETKTSQQLYYSFCFTVPLGSIPEIPAETCKEIKASELGQAVSGDYWFDSVLPGKIILLPCNMETEGQWLYESVKDRLRVMFTLYRIAFSWRLEKSSGIAWTATTPNWKNSSTRIKHRAAGAVSREGLVL